MMDAFRKIIQNEGYAPGDTATAIEADSVVSPVYTVELKRQS